MAVETKSGIYCIYCTKTGKFYIGQAIYLKQRFRQHRHELNNKKHGNNLLQRAWNKYSGWVFEFYVIEYVKEPTKEKLTEREQWWLDITHCWKRHIGYNLNPVGESSLGIKRTEETRAKLSKAKKGKPVHSEISKELIRQARLGQKHSLQSIEKMKIVQNGEKKRKKDKWPHDAGNKCKCDECRIKRNLQIKNWRKSQIGIYVQ